jgi:hypothetical protein
MGDCYCLTKSKGHIYVLDQPFFIAIMSSKSHCEVVHDDSDDDDKPIAGDDKLYDTDFLSSDDEDDSFSKGGEEQEGGTYCKDDQVKLVLEFKVDEFVLFDK